VSQYSELKEAYAVMKSKLQVRKETENNGNETISVKCGDVEEDY
jgi:hypothetical protein